MALTKFRTAILGKLEATYGVDPTPTGAADAILGGDLEVSWPSELVEREDMWTSSLSPKPPIVGGYYGQIKFTAELKGQGALGIVPDYGSFLRGCGFSETVVVSTTVTYAPVSSAFSSMTIYAYRDGLLYKLLGSRGNVAISMGARQRAMLTFTFQGIAQDPIDAAMPSMTLDATVPVPVKSAAFSVGGYAAIISKLDLDMQNKIVISDDMNAATGYGACSILGRSPQGSFDPEHTLVATKNWFSEWKNGTQLAMSVQVGSVAGNRVDITMPKTVYRDLSEGDRNGIYTLNNTFTAAQNVGDDEISIVVR